MLPGHPISRQTWALMRRYFINLGQTPIRSLFRNLLWPCLVTFGTLYVIITYDNKRVRLIAGSPYFYAYRLTVFPVWHFTEWLVNDQATGMKALLISMGLKKSSYYLANTICFMGFILPYLLAAAATSTCYIFLESKSGPIPIVLLFLLFLIQLTGLMLSMSTMLSSPSRAFIAPALLILDISQSHKGVVWLMKHSSESLWPIILFVAGISPLESVRIFSDSYLLCKNCDATQLSDEINLIMRTNLVSQPTYLILTAMIVWSVPYYLYIYLFDQFEPKRAEESDGLLWRTSSCWTTSVASQATTDSELQSVNEIEQSLEMRPNDYFEDRESTNLKVGIRLKGLSKSFNSVPVVDNINFDIYKGETTLLLGHNGAGKTTLMNMILGQLRPDKGEVMTMENSARFGVCPQDSILDDNLNVRQHLQFLTDIKLSPLSGLELKEDVLKTVNEVGLAEQIDARPPQMSVGMRRKLSLAMASVGGSGILVLDEPSSSLDPESRATIWDVVKQYRTNRIVLLSTQHMEEADHLGDRVAIMSSGRIICCGSSIFLTNILGAGYKLRVECSASDADKVLNFVKQYFPEARVSENDQKSDGEYASADANLDIVIELVDRTKSSSELEASLILMLEKIENDSAELGIKSHGLRSSSIEDVLLNTNRSVHTNLNEDKHDKVILKISHSTEEHIEHLLNLSQQTITGSSGFLKKQWSYFKAFLIKHTHYYYRDWRSLVLFRIILPCLGMWSVTRDLNYFTKKTPLGITYTTSIANLLMICHMVYYPTSERISKFKIMQLASQANFAVYWMAQFTMDLLTVLLLACVFNIMLVPIFDGDFLIPIDKFRLLGTLSVVLFGISAALFAYILSTILNAAITSVGYLVLCYSMPQIVTIIIIILVLIVQEPLIALRNVVDRSFAAVLPTESLEYIIYGFGSKCYIKEKDEADTSDPCEESEEFSPVIYGLISLCAQILVYGLLLYSIERKNLSPSNWRNLIQWSTRESPQRSSQNETDIDVAEESEKAKLLVDDGPNSNGQNYCLVAANLSKSYTKGVKVIKNLSLAVKRGECFGLLGVNGAGKSTTFSMIATEIKPDLGKILLNGYDSINDNIKYRRQLGYDPQSNPEMSLSPTEALYLMARLRNVREQAIPNLVGTTLELLEMAQHSKKSVKNLSGGTKRKLALAISFIGNPEMLALDEPTSGIDPIARRKIWQLLRSLCWQAGVSTIISSQAMEECEAICDRISIMVRGQLRCIGSFLHLRSKFFHNFIVKAQINDSHVEASELFTNLSHQLELEFGQSLVKLMDLQSYSATFNISDISAKRSAVLKSLRAFKERHPSVDFVLNDSSLEDIFMSLARESQQQQQN